MSIRRSRYSVAHSATEGPGWSWRSLVAEAGVSRRQIVAGGCVAMLVAASSAVGCGSDGGAPASGSGTADVSAHDSVLTGTITYMQRGALPRDATVVITPAGLFCRAGLGRRQRMLPYCRAAVIIGLADAISASPDRRGRAEADLVTNFNGVPSFAYNQA